MPVDLHKQLATRLQTALAQQGHPLQRGHALQTVAALHGTNWHTLKARPELPRLPPLADEQALTACLSGYGVALSSEMARGLLDTLALPERASVPQGETRRKVCVYLSPVAFHDLPTLQGAMLSVPAVVDVTFEAVRESPEARIAQITVEMTNTAEWSGEFQQTLETMSLQERQEEVTLAAEFWFADLGMGEIGRAVQQACEREGMEDPWARVKTGDESVLPPPAEGTRRGAAPVYLAHAPEDREAFLPGMGKTPEEALTDFQQKMQRTDRARAMAHLVIHVQRVQRQEERSPQIPVLQAYESAAGILSPLRLRDLLTLAPPPPADVNIAQTQLYTGVLHAAVWGLRLRYGVGLSSGQLQRLLDRREVAQSVALCAQGRRARGKWLQVYASLIQALFSDFQAAGLLELSFPLSEERQDGGALERSFYLAAAHAGYEVTRSTS